MVGDEEAYDRVRRYIYDFVETDHKKPSDKASLDQDAAK